MKRSIRGCLDRKVRADFMSGNERKNFIRKTVGGFGLVLLWFGVFSIILVQMTTCTQGSEDAWAGSLIIFFPLCFVFILFAWLGIKTPSFIKWFSLPLFFILPWAFITVLKYIKLVTIGNNHLCVASTGIIDFNTYSSSWWAIYWGPLQLIFLVLVGWCLCLYWLPQKAFKKEAR